MFRFILSLCFLWVLFIGCQKTGTDQPQVDINDLKGKWKFIATKSGPDTLNPQGLWTNINYTKNTTVQEIYCVNDSRTGQSFLSTVNCAYYQAPGSIVAVVSSDCARSIFMRDTVWMQLTAYDLILKEAASFDWVEGYTHSKRLNLINQSCNSLQYNPESVTGFTRTGNWTFDEASQTITINFTNTVNPYNGDTQSKFSVTKFSGTEVELKMQGAVGIEFRLQKQ